ncbi:HvfC/BufC N-terminal domain-containing protein [Pseudogulbenkiania subflava]|uniref:Putative DNA-binding domain-containing protein n=1 Tax=Pseudogulbenkiania subflava DSM 22618 TaxID=1123014 RepID=A0A1Y6BEA1_9NEIS|nr:putative DNA-binding domain-containing protein [Pseudogulbenkiania subflava]SME99038.1 Putative DNA-binding domain-containing protein [Pseudogulbenkiania subflava DSM 22618]
MISWTDWSSALLEAIADPERHAPSANLGLSAAGLAVYRNNYRVGLIDTLAYAYPVLGQLVGEEFFRALAREYVKRHASHSGNLHRYGAAFGDFLDSFEHVRHLPYLADVARLEWHVHRSYYAADATPPDLAVLATLEPERWGELRFGLADDVAVVASPWPIATIWLAHQPDSGVPLPERLGDHAETALVTRSAGTVKVERLDPATAAFLLALQQGAMLEAATNAALQPDPSFDLQALLGQLFERALLSSIQLPGGPS